MTTITNNDTKSINTALNQIIDEIKKIKERLDTIEDDIEDLQG
ncbi:Uncharacterised protein [uncultured archaeon]|nr:Uncharacterised protein [uncultured archaeon]